MKNGVQKIIARANESNGLIGLFTDSEWEALCDRCGICCLFKIEDAKTGLVYYTRVKCALLDKENGACIDYSQRFVRISSCTKISPDTIGEIAQWLPRHCAYRRLYERAPLPDWHPLAQKDRLPIGTSHEILDKIRSVVAEDAKPYAGLSIQQIFALREQTVFPRKTQLDNQLIANIIHDCEI